MTGQHTQAPDGVPPVAVGGTEAAGSSSGARRLPESRFIGIRSLVTDYGFEQEEAAVVDVDKVLAVVGTSKQSTRIVLAGGEVTVRAPFASVVATLGIEAGS